MYATGSSVAEIVKITNTRNYQLLHQYHKILVACNIQEERAYEFSFNIAQSQYFVVLMQQLFYLMAKSFCRTTQWFCRATKVFCRKICLIILRRLFLGMKVKGKHFRFYRLVWNRAIFVSVQYRKILHICITFISMTIYFSHTIILAIWCRQEYIMQPDCEVRRAGKTRHRN